MESKPSASELAGIKGKKRERKRKERAALEGNSRNGKWDVVFSREEEEFPEEGEVSPRAEDIKEKTDPVNPAVEAAENLEDAGVEKPADTNIEGQPESAETAPGASLKADKETKKIDQPVWERQIENAESFDELYDALRDARTIEITRKKKKEKIIVEKLIEHVEKARSFFKKTKKEFDEVEAYKADIIQALPDKYGIRDRVVYMIMKEKKEREFDKPIKPEKPEEEIEFSPEELEAIESHIRISRRVISAINELDYVGKYGYREADVKFLRIIEKNRHWEWTRNKMLEDLKFKEEKKKERIEAAIGKIKEELKKAK